METDRLLPTSIESEMSTLGSLLIDPEALQCVMEFLQPEDLYARDAHRVIYQTILDLWRSGIPADLITLVDEIGRRGKLEEVGGASYISSLANAVPTSANVEYYARIVHRNAVLRHVIHFAGDVAGQAYQQADDLDTTLEEVRRAWHVVEQHAERGNTRGRSELVHAGVALDELHGDILARMTSERRDGITTGYRDLDTHITTFEPGDLIYLCGRPGTGKSTTVQGIIQHNVETCEEQGRGVVALFSLEMRRQQVMNRFVCAHAGVNTQLWRSGFRRPDGQVARASYERWKESYDQVYPMLDRRLVIQDTSCTVQQIHARLTRAVDEQGCRFAVIDYLGLIRPEDRRQERVRQIGDISIALKQMAVELGIPLLAIVQMSRSSEGRENKRPSMADLRDSGQQEQDADWIFGLYRGAYYDHERAAEDEVFRRFTELLVLKARDGVGDQTMIPLRAELEYSRFSSWPEHVDWPEDKGRSARERATGAVAENDERWWSDE